MMKRMFHKVSGLMLFGALVIAASCTRDPYVRTMRAGASAFDDKEYIRAAGLFKETLQADTTFASLYDYALASHAGGDDPEAIRALDTLRKQSGLIPPEYEAQVPLNLGNAALTEAVKLKAQEQAAPQDPSQAAAPAGQQQSQATPLFQQAVEAYESYLLLEPDDLDVKERYLYAKSQLPPQDGGGGGGSDNQQNQDQNQDQQNQDQKNDQDQNNDQNQDQNQQDQNQDQQDQQNQQQPKEEQQQDQLDQEQIYQLLEMKEKQTREKIDEKKAKAIQLRQKDKKKW